MKTRDTKSHCPFLIVGSGAIGLSLAWELARRHQRVMVIESEPNQHPPASWAGAGILPAAATRGVVDPYEQLRSLSHRLHAQWHERLLAETGIDTGFRRCGGIYVAASSAEAATLKANEYWCEEHGIEYHRVDRNELIQLEPRLKEFADERMRGAWLVPDECQIRNPRYLKALRAANEKLGVEFRQARVERITMDASGLARLEINCDTSITADRICICSGSWTRMLLEPLGVRTGIMPVRGQILLFRTPQPILTRIVNEGSRYLVPRDDGLLLAGSVEEEVGYAIETTEEALESIGRWAGSIVRGLYPLGEQNLLDATVEKTWAGLRPGSFDGLPYLGAVPGFHNLYVATGHFRSGLHLSCGTAAVMANLMLDEPNEIDLNPFRVSRG